MAQRLIIFKHYYIYIILIIISLGLVLAPLSLHGDTIIYIAEEPFNPSLLSVEDQILYFTDEYEVDSELALSIAYAESEYKNIWNSRHNERPDYYTAFGIFQIVRGTYKSYCGDPEERFDVTKNIECGVKILSTPGGENNWNESRHVWGHVFKGVY